MTRRVAVLLGDPERPNSVAPDRPFGDDYLQSLAELRKTLVQLEGYEFRYLTNHATLLDDLRALRGNIDLVFNLCDEGFGNRLDRELHVPALLEILDLPYTGAGPECLSWCFDKSLVRHVAAEEGVKVARGCILNGAMPLPYPVIVKPCCADGSWGITMRSVAADAAALDRALAHLRGDFAYTGRVLIEEFLPGADLTVGIIGNPGCYRVLPVLEDSYHEIPAHLPRVCGYEAKWRPDSPYWNVRPQAANLTPAQHQAVVAGSLRMAERLACRDYVRCDWRLDAAGEPRLLEVNPNPGWGWEGDGHFAKMARLAGMTYPQMLLEILRAAERRHSPLIADR